MFDFDLILDLRIHSEAVDCVWTVCGLAYSVVNYGPRVASPPDASLYHVIAEPPYRFPPISGRRNYRQLCHNLRSKA